MYPLLASALYMFQLPTPLSFAFVWVVFDEVHRGMETHPAMQAYGGVRKLGTLLCLQSLQGIRASAYPGGLAQKLSWLQEWLRPCVPCVHS
jgi:hypothetical protein